MKKSEQKILLLMIALYFLTSYTDLKKGFIEGFLQKTDNPVKATGKGIKSDDIDGLIFPVIIKID